MSFLDVAFLPSQPSFYAIFLTDCYGGYVLETATCIETVPDGEEGSAFCEMLLFRQVLFLSHLNFLVIIRLF